jgi:GNAT superfamily N-acetyltransferase
MTTATNSLPPERSIHMRIAHSADSKAIARIINAAFVVERMAFDGDRINALGVSDLMKKGPFLLAEDAIELAGCVYVEVRGARSYLGLLSVGPARQGTGLGRLLVAEAEEYSRQAGCHAMELRIISPRAEPLLPFYQHLGYSQTGTAAFSSDVTPKVPCYYITMAKPLR